MAANKLLLNSSKTEFLPPSTPQQLLIYGWLKSLKLGESFAELPDAAHNLLFDSTMSLTEIMAWYWFTIGASLVH